MDTLLSLGLKIENPDSISWKKKEKLPLEGLTFVITGTLPRPRKEAEDLIERGGGRTASSVSGSTDYLLTGEEPGSKLEKARTLGVRIISYEDLVKMLEKNNENPRLF